MNIKPILISQLAKLILGTQLWQDCRTFVLSIESTSYSGTEKRIHVLNSLQAVFNDISVALLNCGIELAVAWVRSQQP